MPSDSLQIALEHHRSGRLEQAEAIYRQLIAQNSPQMTHASHWLGVLLLQAGQVMESLPLLERAAEAEPRDTAFQFNLAQAYQAAGQFNAAVRTFSAAAELDDQKREVWLGLGAVLLKRGRSADAALAVQALERAVRMKSDAQSLYLLGIAQRQTGDTKGARKSLLKALEDEPNLVQGWYALASLDAAEGNVSQAIGLLRRTIKIEPHFVAAYEALATLLKQQGHSRESKEILQLAQKARETKSGSQVKTGSVSDLQRKIAADPNSLPMHYALASLTNVTPPSNVPHEAVSGLFDKYADYFDEHLQGTLQYRAPELLAEAIKDLQLDRPVDILDMGCGTGICGPLLKPFAASLIGIDLSAGMVEKARERGVYDRLHVGDLVEFLQQSPASFDLLNAADVLLYLGDLQPTFEAAVACLRPGGYFAFTVEATSGNRFELQTKTRRYRHSQEYVQKLADMFGFDPLRIDTVILRLESQKPVQGYLTVLRLPGAPTV
jgi:predicted TPR repeat methyltransferase